MKYFIKTFKIWTFTLFGPFLVEFISEAITIKEVCDILPKSNFASIQFEYFLFSLFLVKW